ncbi:MAG: SRPBCC family protein [Steroidobacteraceae bacterium]
MRVRRCGKWLVWPLVAASSLVVPAHAAQVLGVHVTRAGERFLIGMRITIAAPPAAVFRALQDYSAMLRYNPDLRAVRVEPTAMTGRVRLFTTIHTCVLIFCKTMRQEEVMTATTNAQGGVLEATLLARGGSFKGGRGRWTVGPCPTDRSITCMNARVELVPAFWVPPVIGPWVIRRKMVEEARRTSTGLERIARRLAD